MKLTGVYVVVALVVVGWCERVVVRTGLQECPEGFVNRSNFGSQLLRLPDVERLEGRETGTIDRVYAIRRDGSAAPIQGLAGGRPIVWDGGQSRDIVDVLNDRLDARRAVGTAGARDRGAHRPADPRCGALACRCVAKVSGFRLFSSAVERRVDALVGLPSAVTGPMAVITAGVGVVVLPTHHRHGGYVIAPVAFVVAVGMIRFARCGVFVTTDGVRVRSMVKTTALAWDQIEEFKLSQFGTQHDVC